MTEELRISEPPFKCQKRRLDRFILEQNINRNAGVRSLCHSCSNLDNRRVCITCADNSNFRAHGDESEHCEFIDLTLIN